MIVQRQRDDESVVFSYSPHQGYVFALHQQLPERPGGVGPHLDLVGLVKDDVHELVEAKDFPFEPDGVVVVEPELNPGLALEEAEDDCKGVDTSWLSLLRHL